MLHRNKPELATRNLLRNPYIDLAHVRQRLSEGADVRAPNERGESVLQVYGAADLDVFAVLLDAGADPRASTCGYSVLDRVLNDGRCTATHLKMLLDRGAEFLQPDSDGGTPLHNLAGRSLDRRGRLAEVRAMVEMMLGLGYDINGKDARGCTPLWRSLQDHARNLVEFFEFQRCRGYCGGTWDSEHDRVAILLLEHGADPNARWLVDPEPLIPAGATPLMVQRYDDARLVKALLKAGAEPTLKSDEGKTPLDYARDEANAPSNGMIGVDPAKAAAVAAVLERAMRARPSARG